MEEKINNRLQEIEKNAKKAAEEEKKKIENNKSYEYEPYKYTEDDEKILNMIENEVVDKKENNNNEFKATSTIKLDDVNEDDKFFDDFFDD